MLIDVYSRHAIENMQPIEVPHLIVSINCPGESPANIRTNRATLGRVNLFFWDLDWVNNGPAIVEGSLGHIPDNQLCQPVDAQKVINLVEAHPDAQHIAVHCTAGISRSAGVAGALHKVLNGSDAPIFGLPHYHPNMRVYRMILVEWYNRHPL